MLENGSAGIWKKALGPKAFQSALIVGTIFLAVHLIGLIFFGW
ncbi:hypothetical protein GGD70_007838 [Paraburkholderia fungorum]|nr:hypothetical protein [Paraburkholderia fungorum]